MIVILEYTESVWLSIMFGEASQIERVTGFAKLNAARKAKKEATGKKVEGRKSYAEFNPEIVKTVRKIKRRKDKITGKPMSLRKISAVLYEGGFTNSNGKKLGPSVIRDVLAQKI